MSETILGRPPVASILSTREVAALMGQAIIVSPRPTPIQLGTQDIESCGMEIRGCVNAAPASNNYPAVDQAIFVPFGIAERIVALQLWCMNGAAVAGNLDMGIYDSAGNRLVSKGSTAQSGTNALQLFDITDTTLQPGRYYLAINSDTSGTTQKVYSWTGANAGILSSMGVLEAAIGALALPSTVTFASPSHTAIPWIGLTRSTAS